MSNVDVYQILATTLNITRKAAKQMVYQQMVGGGSNLVKAEWEVIDAPTHFKHRIVLKDVSGVVVKTSHWCPYRSIARIDYGGVMYRASTEYHDGDLPTNCVFTVNAPGPCPSCVDGRVPSPGGGSEPCRICKGTRHQEFFGVIQRGSEQEITPLPRHFDVRSDDPGSVLGIASGRGEHGEPGHRCSGFCPHFAREQREDAAVGRAADAMYNLLKPSADESRTPDDRPPVKRYERGVPVCDAGTEWCTGRGDKHECDPRTAR